MVHFDVKPDNLLVDGDWSTPNGPVVKVVSLAVRRGKQLDYRTPPVPCPLPGSC